MYYDPYDPNNNNNQQPPFPPGTILPAGQTIDVIYAQSYANMQNQPGGVDNRYNPAGVDYSTYSSDNSYSQPQPQPQQDYYAPQPSPRPYSTDLSRFKINPSYADSVHVESPAQFSNNDSSQYSNTPQYNNPPQYSNNSAPYSSNSSQYPYSNNTSTQYSNNNTSSYSNNNTSSYSNNSSQYPLQYNTQDQYSSSNSQYNSYNSQPQQNYQQPYTPPQKYPAQQDQWQAPTQWQPTQPPPTVAWAPPPSNPPLQSQSSSQNLYPNLPPSPRLQHYSSANNVQYNPQPTQTYSPPIPPKSPRLSASYTPQQNLQPPPSYSPVIPRLQSTNPPQQNLQPPTTSYSPVSPRLQAPAQSSNPPQQSQYNLSPRLSAASSSATPPPQNLPPMVPSPRLERLSGTSTNAAPPTPNPADLLAQQKLQQAIEEERQKVEKEKEELAKQQQLLKLQQEEFKMQEDKLKALHTQEELKLRSEIEKQRDEVEKMKAELMKQNAEKEQLKDQRDKVIEIQKGEMKRQMDELMKERELVKKHEEEMRRAMLEEQRLMLQQLQQQQAQLAQEQKSITENAQQAELKRQQEHNKKLEEQRRTEGEMLKARHDLEIQQQALIRQMEEAKEAARKLEEQQRVASEQRVKVEAQQKQTAEEKRQAEEQRKQAEEQLQNAIKQQKQQQEAFARQQEEIKKKQADITAEQERMKLKSQESEARIQTEKQLLTTKLQEQHEALKKQQEDIKRQQELVTLQQKELLLKQKEQQEQAEKEKASHAIKDLLAPMRQITAHDKYEDLPTSPKTHSPGKLAMPQFQPGKVPAAANQATGKASERPLKRSDSRYLPNLNLDAVVEGYLMRDVVRAQRYARRWLMRKHFVAVVQQYHSSDDKVVDRLRHRNKALREIYTSELSYVANLQLLSNFYLVPMQVESMVLKTFSDKDAHVIFSSVNTLLDVSKSLVAELETRLEKWPSVQLFGDIFVRLAPVMKLYAEYINNFDSASQRLKTLLSLPEGFSFFEACKAKSRSPLDINSLLIMPVQRVPRYELLLRELIRFTDESHVDYNNLVLAQKAIQQVNTYINQKKKDVDSRQKLTTIQNQVKNCPNLMLAHRYYVYEGNLQVSTTDKHKTGSFYFFLFNDMFMATKKAGGIFHRHDYEFVFSINITEAVVKRVSELLMFRIMIGGLEDINVSIYTFLCQSAADKENWLKSFVSIMNDSASLPNSKRLLVKEASQANVPASLR